MATRAAIGVWTRRNAGFWRGTYHHWDGYPSGLGQALWQLYHEHFEGLLPAMVELLIDANPEGWSTIVDRDFSQRPTWLDFEDEQRLTSMGKPLPPLSYKARGEEPNPLDQASDVGLEWAYVFDLERNTMSILQDVGRLGRGQWIILWLEKASLPMLGSEPDWSIFE